MANECEGCYSYKGDECKACVSGIGPHIPETFSCPCLTCIVKMMCSSGLSCEKFAKYSYLYIAYNRKMEDK